ncbi:MAG: hypothetical protein HRT87_11035 [Legionellales bacterium]|nr:hypothetical protein [Legionellales bacterium]
MGNKFTNVDEKSFDYASQSIKQIITLSTAVLASSVMFSEKLSDEKVTTLLYLKFGWCFLLISILFGMFALFGLTSELIKDHCNDLPSIKSPIVRYPALLQASFFIFSLAALFGNTIVLL